MGRKVVLLMGAIIMAAMVAPPASAQAQAEAPAQPNIIGNYILVSRDLPDGQTLTPPAVTGFMTFTDKYRNFNVMWKDADGKALSISFMGEYTLTPTAYTEKPIMWVMTNEASPEKVFYSAPAEKGQPNPVTMKDGAVTFPVAGEPPVITFHGHDLTAVAEGQFVDHWKKLGGE